MEPIDVCIPTSGNTPHLSEAISAIERCLLVNNILRADGGSLGEARQRLIDAATTERFLMLDSDVVLQPGPWFQDAVSSKDCVVLQMPLAVEPLQKFVSFWNRLGGGGRFFGTMATFFSKGTLEGIRIPSMGAGEDLFIMLWLQKKGVKIRTVWVPGMHHHSPDSDKGRWIGEGLKNLQAYVGFRAIMGPFIRNILLYPFAVTLVSIFKRDLKVERYCLALWKEYLRGYFG